MIILYREVITVYQERFENLFRVALKITSSLNISDILETLRDEAKLSIPNLQEACLLLVDPEAADCPRPLTACNVLRLYKLSTLQERTKGDHGEPGKSSGLSLHITWSGRISSLSFSDSC